VHAASRHRAFIRFVLRVQQNRCTAPRAGACVAMLSASLDASRCSTTTRGQIRTRAMSRQSFADSGFCAHFAQ
jgi:hypothetical protein